MLRLPNSSSGRSYALRILSQESATESMMSLSHPKARRGETPLSDKGPLGPQFFMFFQEKNFNYLCFHGPITAALRTISPGTFAPG
jgi:hypothetical protein